MLKKNILFLFLDTSNLEHNLKLLKCVALIFSQIQESMVWKKMHMFNI